MWPEVIAGVAAAALLLSLFAFLHHRARMIGRCHSYCVEMETLRHRLRESERALERLTLRLAALTEAARHRALSERQHDLLARALLATSSGIVHVRIHDDRETLDYGDSFVRALAAGGARVTTERIHSSEADGARFGDMITLRGTEAGRHVLAACRAAGIPLRTQYAEEHLPEPRSAPASGSARPDAIITLNQRLSVEGRVALLLADPMIELGSGGRPPP